MGTCTAVIKKRNYTGASKVVVADVTFSNSYATGGDTLTASTLGFVNSIDCLIAAPTGGLMFEFDHTNKKLKATYPTGGANAAPTSATAVPAHSADAVPVGATAVTSTAAQPALTAGAQTPGVGKEVGSTADLSTITCRVIAFGDNPYV